VVYLPEDIFYSGLARSAWALGISFVMISCSLNQGGEFNTTRYNLTKKW